MHGAHGAGIGVGALITHDADAHDGKQHGKALPDLVIEPGGLDLRDYDLVGLLQQCNALRGHFAQDAHGQTGAGEGLAAENIVGHAQVAADAADFVFEQVAQWLNQLELHAQRQATDVVMALDGLAGALYA